jgi:hypothetical protein
MSMDKTRYSSSGSLRFYLNPHEIEEKYDEDAMINFHALRLRNYTARRDALRSIMEPRMLLQVIQENQAMSFVERATFFEISESVAHSVHCHPESLTRSLLWKLTDERFCPFLCPSFEAPVLLLADCLLGATPLEFSGLQQRCIASITTYWSACYYGLPSLGSSTTNNPDIALLEFLHRLPQNVLLTMISETCEKGTEVDDEADIHALAIRLFGAVRSKLLSAPSRDEFICGDNDESLAYSFDDEGVCDLFLDQEDLEEYYLDEPRLAPPVEYVYCPTIV